MNLIFNDKQAKELFDKEMTSNGIQNLLNSSDPNTVKTIIEKANDRFEINIDFGSKEFKIGLKQRF